MAASVAASVKVTGLAITTMTTGAIATTTGQTFVIVVSSGTATGAPNTPSDNQSNTYTQLGTTQGTNNGGQIGWYAKENGTGGASHTFTETFASSADAPVMLVAAITGVLAASLDTASRAQVADTATPFTVTSGAFAQADEIVLCCIDPVGGASNPATYTESTGFATIVSELDEVTFWTCALASKNVLATTALTPSWTSDDAADSNCGLHIIGLKSSTGGADRGKPIGPFAKKTYGAGGLSALF